MSAKVEQDFYRAWKESGASAKVLLALFEAGIVESGLENLDHGDRDSIGALQQRAPWGTKAERLDAYVSAKKFISKAKAKEKSGQSAGQLAQAVQVSAFPLKYDAAKAKAEAIIAKLGGAGGGGTVQNVGLVDGLAQSVDKITDPHTWWRFGLNLAGFLLIIIGVIAMVGKPVIGGKLKMVTDIAGKVAK
jgi:hypothetical protein